MEAYRTVDHQNDLFAIIDQVEGKIQACMCTLGGHATAVVAPAVPGITVGKTPFDQILQNDHNMWKRCCCRRVYSSYGDHIESWLNIWHVLKPRIDVHLIGYERQLGELTLTLKKIVSSIERLPEKNESNKQVANDKLEEVKKKIGDLKYVAELANAQKDLITKQGDKLEECVDAVTIEKVFKASSRMQHIINYILYIIFIINAFIAGFGMTNLSSN